jgi:hypothetical protein
MSRKRNRRSTGESEGAGSILVRYGSMLLLAVVVILVVLTLGSCTIKKPSAPEWDTQFTVPMVSRTYDMPELIRKMNQTGIGFDLDSNVVFSITKQLDTVFLNADNLTTDSLSYSLSKQLGPVTITPPAITPVSTNLTTIAGMPGVYPATLPAMGFTVPGTLPVLSTFSSAIVDTGKIYVVVTNNLGVNLDVVGITVTDLINGTTVGTSVLTHPLLWTTKDSVLLDLSGKTISNSLVVTVVCHTPGGTINTASGKTFDIAPYFAGNLVVSAATAEVPATSRSITSSLDLNETDVITDATVTGGDLRMVIANNSGITATMHVTIPDLLSGGNPFVINQQVAAHDSSVIARSLTGYHMHPADVTVPQSLPVNVQVDIPSSSPNKVSIAASQSFTASVTISALSFGSVTGVFSGSTATFDSIVRDIDIPKGLDSAQILNAVLTLQIENGVGLPGSLDLHLTGNNGKNLNIDGTISPRLLATAATTELVEPNIGTFLSPLPSQVTFSGSASFGNGTSGTIRTGDFIAGSVRIDAPLELILAQTTLQTDVTQDSISQDNIERITDHVKEARFVYNLINHLPIGATVNIVVSSDSTTLYTNPELRFDSISVNAAPTSGGIVTDTLSTGFQTISLDSAQIQILKHPVLYIGNELILHGSNGQAIRLTKNDFVTVQARIEVEYHFDGNL